MATPFLKVYDAFLARITADEWTLEEELAIVERDWQELLRIGIFRFKYPSWENIRQLYADKDFSQANHLDKLNKLESAVNDEVHKFEGIYDRSRNKRPAELFKKLAGKKNVV